MKRSISESSLSRISEFILVNMGLDFPKNRWPDLINGIESVSRELNHTNPESCIKWILSSPLTKEMIETLASHLTIGETYFFRYENVFNALKRDIFPELIQSRRKNGKCLRLWSAACATGEEPYSLAILLSKMIPDLSDWNITILATDINPIFLKKASLGAYTKWSFRNTPEWVKGGYFNKTEDGHYHIDPRIKKMVRFSYLNLMDDCYPSMTNNTNAMDVIFCRNVLMYFSQENKEQVLNRVYRSNVDSGWLVVSPGEMPHQSNLQFTTVHLNEAIFYRKNENQAPLKNDCKVNTKFLISETPFDYPGNSEQQILFRDQTNNADERVPLPPDVLQDNLKLQEDDQPSYQRSLDLFERGCYVEAAESLHDLLSSGETEAETITLLVRVYANQGDLAKAERWCKKAISTDKLNPNLYYLLSTIMVEQDKTEEALTALKTVTYLDSNFIVAYFTLGNINSKLGKLNQAKRNFGNAINLLCEMEREEIVPESDGITAGRLIEVIKLSVNLETLYGK